MCVGGSCDEGGLKVQSESVSLLRRADLARDRGKSMLTGPFDTRYFGERPARQTRSEAVGRMARGVHPLDVCSDLLRVEAGDEKGSFCCCGNCSQV